MGKFQVKINMAGRSVVPTPGPYGEHQFRFPTSFEEVSKMTLVEKVRRALGASPISLVLPPDAGKLSPEEFLQRVLEVSLARCGSSEQSLGIESNEPAPVSMSMNSFCVTPAQQAR